MTRRDNGKASLVEFLRSIKFAHQKPAAVDTDCPTHFAQFDQRAGVSSKEPAEENEHVRSAN
jgi:nitrite reductase/ring-hydroxylating ferredoxin subunit